MLKSKIVSVIVLLMMVVGFLVYVPSARAASVSSSLTSSSTSESLTASAVAETVTYSASHVVQPFGKYRVTPSGTVYAANGVDNVTITLSSGFPSFVGYSANSTLQQWTSGCQKVVMAKSGADLVISYEGTACGIAPVLKVTFSPLPVSTTTCSLFWKAESYSWCGDSGISYSAGVLTMVAPSANYHIDPYLQQTSYNECGNCASISQTYSSHPTSGDVLIAAVAIDDGTINAFTAHTPTDTLNCVGGWLPVVSQSNRDGNLHYENTYLWYCPSSISGADTVSLNFTGTPSSAIAAQLTIYELAPSGLGNTGTGNCVSACSTALAATSTSFTSTTYIAISTAATDQNGLTAGGSFTQQGTALTSVQAQYSTTVSSPTTFPQTQNNPGALVGWSESGAIFLGDVPETTLLNLYVNLPPGGAIVYSGTTISTSSILTITPTTTWTVTAVPFASYIFDGWSGFSCSDLINPVQTCSVTTISSYTTASTVNATLTANFSAPGGSVNYYQSSDGLIYALLAIVVSFILTVAVRKAKV